MAERIFYDSITRPDMVNLNQFLANVNTSSCSLYVVVRLSVVCLSVTFVHPTQAIEIFVNVSMSFGTLTIFWHQDKILRRSSQGNPSIVGVKHEKGRENIVILDLSNAISRKRCKIGARLVLITNKKLHMSFQLVPNSVTLDDLERRNSPNSCVISLNSVTFGTDCVTVVEDTPILSVAEM